MIPPVDPAAGAIRTVPPPAPPAVTNVVAAAQAAKTQTDSKSDNRHDHRNDGKSGTRRPNLLTVNAQGWVTPITDLAPDPDHVDAYA